MPDQRDTYPGQQVTIFDNRGICQHSGLCTDRAADGVPHRRRAVRRPQRRTPRRAHPGRTRLPVRRAEPGLRRRRGSRATWPTGTARGERAIEVTQDGPYRVTGGIPLDRRRRARDVPRAAGSSREHYALCRCGHSQNKPFCSGMHWYVDFRDPARPADPTLFEWAGGLPALTRMTRLLYEKLVPADAAARAAVRAHGARVPAARGGRHGGGRSAAPPAAAPASGARR